MVSIQVTNKYKFKIHGLHYIGLTVLVGSGLTQTFCTAVFHMLCTGEFPNKQIQCCSPQPSSPLSTSCHALPALLPAGPCYIHKVCAPVKRWINNWRRGGSHSLQCYLLLPYPPCFQKAGRAALRVAGLQDMSRSQQPLLSQGQWGQSRSSGGGQAVRLSIPQSLTKCPWKTFSCCTNLAATKIHNTSSVTRMQNDSETKYLHLSKIQIVFLLLGNNKMAHLGEYNPASFLMRCCFC